MAKKREADPNRLIRIEAGRYRTEDGRFEASSDSAGAWYLTDAEQADELGLPRLSGPFRTMAELRDALAAARDAARPALRVIAGTGTPSPTDSARTRRRGIRMVAPGEGDAAPPQHTDASEPPPRARASRRRPRAAVRDDEPAAVPAEPTWLERLEGEAQRQARALMEALSRASFDDPAAIVQTDLETPVPEVARALLARRLWDTAVKPWLRDDGTLERALEVAGQGGTFTEAREALDRIRSSGVQPDDLRIVLHLVAFASVSRAMDAAGSIGTAPSEPPELPGWSLRERRGEDTGRTFSLSGEDLLRFRRDG